MKLLRNPIILALDVDSREEAFRIFDPIKSDVGGVKLGPRLVYRYGASFVAEIAKSAPVFVDNKYFDIPSTMVAAVRSSFEAGASLVTVHAMAGREALSELASLEAQLNSIRPFKILAVSILTSWSQQSFPENFKDWSVEKHVESLVSLAHDCGLTGVVCSGHELKTLSRFNGLFTVVPGIRAEEPQHLKTDEDQKRIMTPAQAMNSGASALVIGRPILKAEEPKLALKKILESCK